MERYHDIGDRSNHCDGGLLRRKDQSTTSWWLPMSWRQKLPGHRQPPYWLEMDHNTSPWPTNHITHQTDRVWSLNKPFERGGEIDNPLVSLLLTGSSSQDDNTPWCLPGNMSHYTVLVTSSHKVVVDKKHNRHAWKASRWPDLLTHGWYVLSVGDPRITRVVSLCHWSLGWMFGSWYWICVIILKVKSISKSLILSLVCSEWSWLSSLESSEHELVQVMSWCLFCEWLLQT